MTALLLGLLVSVASAHSPHDIATALVASPSISGRMWAVFDPNDVSQLLRSDDGGRHWDFVGGPEQDLAMEI